MTKHSFWKQLIRSTEFYLMLFLIASMVFLAIFTDNFFNMNNITGILNRYSYILIAAIGMNLIILTGNIDVSTGALISVVCTFIAAIGKTGAPFPVLLVSAMAMGMLLSFINSLFITKFRIPAIVATLATAQLFSGALPLFNEGSIYDLPDSFTWFSFRAKLFGFLPASVVLMAIITTIALVFMKYSRFSKKIYAVGNNIESAFLSGISANKVITAAYVIAGALFGISSVILATASQRVTTTMGSGLEMTFIAAVVLGGTAVSGGSGKILGTVLGALILSMVDPAANYLGISSDWADTIKGAIIIIAVVVGAISTIDFKRFGKRRVTA